MAKIDTENIKKAFTEFESDNFVDAEDTLRTEIRTALSDHLKTKLNLKNDLVLDKKE